MARLQLSWLGPPRVSLDGNPITDFRFHKELALLTYLASEAHQPHRREKLVGLFWPDLPHEAAHNNLRQVLFHLRKTIGDAAATPPFLLITRETVRFNPDSDYALAGTNFLNLMEACETHTHRRLETCRTCHSRLREAVELYRGNFMEGYFLSDSEAFGDWVLLKREGLRRRAAKALTALATHHEWRGEFELAHRFAQRYLELEPWGETAHRQLMRALALTGQRTAALSQFETCRRVLADELGVEPEAETATLHDRILAADLAALRPSPLNHNLPNPPTPFVGRKDALEAIAERLGNPACRLLTLLGPGGVGKTRLATQAAREQIGVFRDGVCFVPLAALRSSDDLPAAIAAALNLRLHGPESPEAQLHRHLRDKELLLVLDNFEHVLAGTAMVTALLKHSPGVSFLITSRIRLSLRAEWLLAVEGMPCPPDARAGDADEYDAVGLFIQNTRRVRPDRPLSKDELPHVVRACQLLEGLPLGIELAASWLRVMDCEQIVEQLESSLDFLSVSDTDVPERHRSLRALFDHSWALMTDEEQRAFRRLSVFRGEFSGEAAARVAEATPRIILALLDKSLLHVTHGGRSRVHEDLRQYAAEKLSQTPVEAQKTRDGHAAFYLGNLSARRADLIGARQMEVMARIDQTIDNVRAAWDWASARGRSDEIGASLDGLAHYYAMRSQFREAADAFERAAERLMGPDRRWDSIHPDKAQVIGQLCARQGWFRFQLGDIGRARQLLQRGLEISRSTPADRDAHVCLIMLGTMDHYCGEYESADRMLNEGRAIAAAIGDRFWAGIALANLGALAFRRGALEDTRRYCAESLTIAETIGNRWCAAFSLDCLGQVGIITGEGEAARSRLQRALAIRRELDDHRGVGLSLVCLGDAARGLGEHREARRLYQEGLDAFNAIANRPGAMNALAKLGHTACAVGQYADARRHYRAALLLALEIDSVPRALDALSGLATVSVREGKRDGAMESVALVRGHGAATRASRDRADRLWIELGSPSLAGQAESAAAKSLPGLIEGLLAEPPSPPPASEAPPKPWPMAGVPRRAM